MAVRGMLSSIGGSDSHAVFEAQGLDAGGLGVFRADVSGCLLAGNGHLAGWLLEQVEELPGRNLETLIVGFDAERWSSCWAELADGSSMAPFPALFRLGSGRLMPIEVRLAGLRFGSEVTEAFGLLIPIGDRLLEEGVHHVQRAVLEAIAVGRPFKAVMDLLCRRVEDLAPDVLCSVVAIDEAARLHPVAGPSLPEAYTKAVDGVPIGPCCGSCGTAAWRGEPVIVTDIATDPLWEIPRPVALAHGLAACWSTPFRMRGGRVAGTFALYYREPRSPDPFHQRMVDACVHLCAVAFEHEANQAEIRRLAFYDPLTGLPNRALLRDRVERALVRAEREKHALAMLFLDLDRLKPINDSLGHAAGDRILASVASRLASLLRESDTVARIGGDEFVIVLPDCDAAAAQLVADKLNEAMSQRVEIGGMSFTPSASIGISLFPADAQDFDTLLKNADMAMYQAKSDGRNCARFFLKSMNEAADRRLELEAALRQAITQNQLELYYQPKVHVDGSGLAGAEALLRWKHPRRGVVPPDQFIPLAEDCGLITAIDAWVLETACAQIATWDQAGIHVPSVAVNQSALRFTQNDVPTHVRETLAQHGLAPHRLTLELTERLLLGDHPETQRDLTTLRELGVRLSIDDFGTGYSSLSYLTRLPVHELKLDRSFVSDLEANPADRALAAAVIGIGHQFSLSVVAEGVETAGQHAILYAEGCVYAQGYYYSRPMAAAAFAEWASHSHLRQKIEGVLQYHT